MSGPLLAYAGAQQVLKQGQYAAPFGMKGLGAMAASPFFGGALAQALWGGQEHGLQNALDTYRGKMDTAKSLFSSEWGDLMSNFDTSLTNLRSDSKNIRTQALSDMKTGLAKNTDDFVKSLGPLNPQTEASIRTQMTLPVSRQLLEFDLGTTDQDLSMGLSGVMGSLQLERQGQAMMRNMNIAENTNLDFLQRQIDNQPGALSRFLGAL